MNSSTPTRWSRAVVAVLAASTLVLAGCGGERASNAGSGGASGTGSGGGGDDGPVRIVYIPKNLGNPYFDAIVAGFEEKEEELGFEFEVVGPAQAGATDQIPFIDSAIQQGVDAIAISPNDPDAVVPSLKRAMDAGIAVISVNSDMNPDGRQVAILPTDFSTLGTFLNELQGELIGYKGKFAVLSATTTAPDQNSWIESMKKSLETDAKFKDMELVEVVYGDDEAEKSATEMQALLTAHPDLAGVVAPTTVGVRAGAQVLSNSPLKGKVALTGLGAPNEMREYIKDGTVEKFALWDPKLQGLIGSHLLMGMIAGDIEPKGGTSFEVPDLGTVEISEETQILAGPPQVFDQANIDDFDF